MTDRVLKYFMPLVDVIAATFGKNCEVVLHDFSNPSKSILKIANGHVTGREVGNPLTDLGLLFLEAADRDTKNDILIAYRTKTKKGVDLKSSTMFIRNGKGKVVGSLCINIDITPYLSAQNLLNEYCSSADCSVDGDRGETPEKFESNVDVLIDGLIGQAFEKVGKPSGYMEKEDKLRVIRDLRERGLFLIKGAAKRVSKELNVSLPTIYKYLEQI